MSEIFKIQTSLTEPKNHLVYNEKKTIMFELPFDEWIYKLVKNKGFVLGYVEHGAFVIEKKLKNKEGF